MQLGLTLSRAIEESKTRYAIAWPLFVVATAAAIVVIYYILNIRIFDHVSLSYNEGWNAYKAQAVLAGQPIYPTLDQPWVTNYPPLSFYLVAALTFLTHDPIISGRILSLLGILATGASIGGLAAALTRNPRAGLVAGMFLLLAVALWFPTWVGLNDPQWLGHGIQTAGAFILLSRLRERRSLAPVFVGAALMFLGALSKHNLVILPAIVWIFLLFVERKAWLAVTAVFAVLGCAFLVFSALMYGHPFFDQMLGYQRVLSFRRAAIFAINYSFLLGPALIFAVLNLALSKGVWKSWFPAGYILLACASGCVNLAGEGCDYNHLFDVAIAMSLTVGCLSDSLSRIFERGGVARSASLALAALALFTPLAGTLYQVKDPLWSNGRRAAQLPLARSVIGALADANGPVACQMLAWCFWADKPIAYDMFNMSQRAKHGGTQEAQFVDRIANRYFAAIETQSNVATTEDRTPPYWDALTRNYRKIIAEPTEVWVPID